MSVDRAQLAALADEAWALFDESRRAAPDIVVDPSMPILYFGDTRAYEQAPLKVVTVGLNPSLSEFPGGNPWQRFPRAAPDGSRLEIPTYLESLDEYFHGDVWKWFEGGFGPILRGLGTSYASGAAINTDIASPVATDPIWSKLGQTKRRLPSGARLWGELVRVLAPDVVLVSVASEHLEHFGPVTWNVFRHFESKQRSDVLRAEAQIGQRRVPVFFGRYHNVPFGSLKAVEKEGVGKLIKESLA